MFKVLFLFLIGFYLDHHSFQERGVLFWAQKAGIHLDTRFLFLPVSYSPS
jgi:hypothetical protein